MVVAARIRSVENCVWTRALWLGLLAILFTGLTLTLPTPAISQEALDNPVELLRLESVRVERVSTSEVRSNQLEKLLDQNPHTTCVFPATSGEPVDLVYHFGGETVSPEQLIVQLPQNIDATARAMQIEILASCLSPETGYRSLRADPLKSISERQSFQFQPAAARWILIRMTPAPQAKELAIAELSVLGRVGPPVSRYAFKESPVKAFEVLKSLEKSALQQHPGDKHLTKNAIATWNSWAAMYVKAKEWTQAIEIYGEALEAFPDNGTLKNNLKYCEQQQDKNRGH